MDSREPPRPPGAASPPGSVGVEPGGLGSAPRWRPWLGRPRAADLACATGIVLSTVYGFAMIPLTAALITTHPLLLEAISGSTPAIVAAGAFSDTHTNLQFTVVVAAALPGIMKFDLVYWWAGRRWGHRAVERLGHRSARAAAIARRAEQRGSRYAGPVVLVSAFLPGIPAPLIYAAAGWAGLRLLPFLVCDAIGSLVWAAVVAGFGYELGPSGVAAANLVSHYALFATLALVALALTPHAWHVLRRRQERARTQRARLAMVPGTTAGTAPDDQAA